METGRRLAPSARASLPGPPPLHNGAPHGAGQRFESMGALMADLQERELCGAEVAKVNRIE